ncbi:hypothetical protein BBSC_1566 [Bifidobacterium scardovii JCM 12489 = DSM 13734]|nr:hypothetical protein BBSC_1566 [Bifidobacterium scardovii JCM 12489 = DSM 13734]
MMMRGAGARSEAARGPAASHMIPAGDTGRTIPAAIPAAAPGEGGVRLPYAAEPREGDRTRCGGPAADRGDERGTGHRGAYAVRNGGRASIRMGETP